MLLKRIEITTIRFNMSPLEARLYFDEMNLTAYWPENIKLTWDDFTLQFEAKKITLNECDFLTLRQKQAYRIALEPDTYVPSIPTIDVPQPITPDLFALNDPDENALVIITGNNRLTFDVMATIWSQGLTPAYLLLVDCLGNTVDMAMVFERFTSEALKQALGKSGLENKVSHRNMIVPGFTSPLAEDFQKTTRWKVEVGPVCAAEIPLFLKDRWIPIESN